MEKLFKLKKEARQFFSDNMAKKIAKIGFWENEKVHMNLLEQVENVYVDFGIKDSPNSSSLSGWSSNDGGTPTAEFRFTLKVADITNRQYRDVNIPDLMDAIQKVANKFFTS